MLQKRHKVLPNPHVIDEILTEWTAEFKMLLHMASAALAQLYLPCCMHHYLRTAGLGGSSKEIVLKSRIEP